jgi:hypothetical protein
MPESTSYGFNVGDTGFECGRCHQRFVARCRPGRAKYCPACREAIKRERQGRQYREKLAARKCAHCGKAAQVATINASLCWECADLLARRIMLDES